MHPRILMAHMGHTVEHRISHVDVRGGHIDLGPEHLASVGKFAGAHPAEQIKIFLHAPVAVGAFPAGLCQSPAIIPYLLGSEITDIRLTLPY